VRIGILSFVAAVGLPSVALAQGPSHNDAAPPAQRADPTAEVLAAVTVIVDAFGRHDPEAYFALFDPDATFLFYTTPHRLENRAAYEREWATWERELGFRVRSSASTDQRVQLFGDTAVFTHSVRTVISTNEGESTFDERETIVFDRRDEGWIAVHEHLSPAPAASDAAAGNELVPADPAERLVGTWEAVEDQGLGPDGEVVAREAVKGLLVYTPEGRMAVQLMYQGRPEVSTANDEVSTTGVGLGRIGWDAEDARAAIDTYDAYFGSYEIDRDRNLVTHVVVGELRPPGVGARYGRRFEFHGDELWLTPENPAEGWRVVWRRVR
jgi:ketosteroid isomerase-like protein